MRPYAHNLHCKARIFLTFALIFFAIPCAQAAVEISAAANYRKSSIDSNNYQESASFTGSIAYFFWQSEALELSYTDGTSTSVVEPTGSSATKTVWSLQLTGLDLIVNLVGPANSIQPFVKLGGAYLYKAVTEQTGSSATQSVPHQIGIVPSAGVGFRINITQQFGIKLGVDAWTTPLNVHPVIIDYAGRAGLSWLF
jgi:outer membrane protein W